MLLWNNLKIEKKNLSVQSDHTEACYSCQDIHFIVKTGFGLSAVFFLYIFKLKANIYSFIFKNHAAS